jgi:hypothetical protein
MMPDADLAIPSIWTISKLKKKGCSIAVSYVKSHQDTKKFPTVLIREAQFNIAAAIPLLAKAALLSPAKPLEEYKSNNNEASINHRDIAVNSHEKVTLRTEYLSIALIRHHLHRKPTGGHRTH